MIYTTFSFDPAISQAKDTGNSQCDFSELENLVKSHVTGLS